MNRCTVMNMYAQNLRCESEAIQFYKSYGSFDVFSNYRGGGYIARCQSHRLGPNNEESAGIIEITKDEYEIGKVLDE